MMSWSNLTFTLVTLDVNVSSDLGPGVDIVEMISAGPSSRELSSAVLLCDDMFDDEKWAYKDEKGKGKRVQSIRTKWLS
jgi:hypothetical protein